MNKPTSERMREFVDYHINGDGECNAILLAEKDETKMPRTQYSLD